MSPAGQKKSWGAIIAFLVALVVVAFLMISGTLAFNPVTVAKYTALLITAVFLAYYASVYLFGNLSGAEKRSLGALFLVCLASICFWAGFEQAGSSFWGRILGPVEWGSQGDTSFFTGL